MDRRSFLGSILALAAAPAIVRADSLMRIVPRETLVDGLEQFVVTSVSEAGAVQLLTFDQVAREALRIAHEKIQFIGTINRVYEDSFKVGDVITFAGMKRGDTLKIRVPENYQPRKIGA